MKGYTCTNEIKLENGLSSNTCFITITNSEITTKKEEGELETYSITSVADIYSSYQAYTDGKPMMNREVISLSGITYQQLSAGNPYEVIYNLYLKVKYSQDIVDIN